MFLPLKALFFGGYKVDIFVSTYVNFCQFSGGIDLYSRFWLASGAVFLYYPDIVQAFKKRQRLTKLLLYCE